MLSTTRIKRLVLTALFLGLFSGVAAKPVVHLRGEGASFPNAVYKSWMTRYVETRAEFTDLRMSYKPLGSSSMDKSWLDDLIDHDIEYGGSVFPMSEEEYEDREDLEVFPSMAGGVVLSYNLPGITGLNLSRAMIVGIYNGTYTMWNNTDLQNLNSAVELPGERIKVVARSDQSGTTEIFTKALAAFSSEWNNTYGIFSDGDQLTTKWKMGVIDYFGKSSIGASGLILSLRYSIGYMSTADAFTVKLPNANIMNKAGNLIAPSVTSIQMAIDNNIKLTSRFTQDIIDEDGLGSYPIASYTYMVVHLSHNEHCLRPVELYRYIEWFLWDETAMQQCLKRHFVPLTDRVKQKIRTVVLERLTCDGQSVETAVREQKSQEQFAEETWRLPVSICGSVLLLLGACLIVIIIYRQVKISRSVSSGSWFIPIECFKPVEVSSNPDINKSFIAGVASTRSMTTIRVSHPADMKDKTVMYLDEYICLRKTNYHEIKEISRSGKKFSMWMRDCVHHLNIVRYYGLTLENNTVYSVEEHCIKGTLRRILQNDKYNLDANFKFSISCDIAEAMKYLHSKGIVHGNLSASTCVVDNSWTVKITRWTHSQFCRENRRHAHSAVTDFFKRNATIPGRALDDPEEMESEIDVTSKLSLAPELILDPFCTPTESSDIYSFAILLTEIFSCETPYSAMLETIHLNEVLNKVSTEDLRPNLPGDLPVSMRSHIRKCWASNPKTRPTFRNTMQVLNSSKPTKKGLLDCMLEIMDVYTNNLESEVATQTKTFQDLLEKMIPVPVARAMVQSQTVAPESFECVTIFFSNITDFFKLSTNSTPWELVEMLNRLYTVFDSCINKYDVFKVETIGGAYMVMSGAPIRNGAAHAPEIATMALDIARAADQFQIIHSPGTKLQLRAGIHSGPVCTGVIGTLMPRYCIFGDTVNTASRMESTSLSNKIQISQSTKMLLIEVGGFHLEFRGFVEIKGKGTMETYWLNEKDNFSSRDFDRDLCRHGSRKLPYRSEQLVNKWIEEIAMASDEAI